MDYIPYRYSGAWKIPGEPPLLLFTITLPGKETTVGLKPGENIQERLKAKLQEYEQYESQKLP